MLGERSAMLFLVGAIIVMATRPEAGGLQRQVALNIFERMNLSPPENGEIGPIDGPLATSIMAVLDGDYRNVMDLKQLIALMSTMRGHLQPGILDSKMGGGVSSLPPVPGILQTPTGPGLSRYKPPQASQAGPVAIQSLRTSSSGERRELRPLSPPPAFGRTSSSCSPSACRPWLAVAAPPAPWTRSAGPRLPLARPPQPPVPRCSRGPLDPSPLVPACRGVLQGPWTTSTGRAI